MMIATRASTSLLWLAGCAVLACSGPTRNFGSPAEGGSTAQGGVAAEGGSSAKGGSSSGGATSGGAAEPSSAGASGDDAILGGDGGEAGAAGTGPGESCATNNGGCDPLVSCTDTPDGHVCGSCPPGYSGSGAAQCADINECAINNGGCAAMVVCSNTPGGFTCGNCPAGYTGGGAGGCIDINECLTQNGGCDSRVSCTNTMGSFTCGACPAGFTGSGLGTCVDINECGMSNGGCSLNATCTNTVGSRSCACKSGYSGDGLVCTAIPAPVVSSFSANYAAVCGGSMVALTPVFSSGSAVIDHGVGAVTSGVTVLATVSATTTFTLTVTNSANVTATATRAVTALKNGTFTATASLPAAPSSAVTALLKDGRVLLLAGGDTADLYDPATGTFTQLSHALNAPRGFPMASVLSDGRVLIAGGTAVTGALSMLSSAEIFDPATGIFTTTGSLAMPRFRGTLTALTNGKVLAPGGAIDPDYDATNTADLFNPLAGPNGTFSPGPMMASHRLFQAATLLASGKVLVAGGCFDDIDDPCVALKSAELYDPTVGSVGAFSNTGSMSVARGLPAAALLLNGTVLIAGAQDPVSGMALASAELFDPQSGTNGAFSVTGSMLTARFLFTATTLPNGKVLVAGGSGPDGSALASAELYDPGPATFSATGSMAVARRLHAATPLNNGTVLVVGGGDLRADLYCP